MIDYNPLWKTMEQQKYHVHIIEKLCRILDCTPNDILAFINDDTNNCLKRIEFNYNLERLADDS